MPAKGKVTATLFVLFFLSLYGDIPTVDILKRNVMEVTVNRQNYIVPEDCNVLALITTVLQRPDRGLAIAINENIVPRTQWDTRKLNSGDNIIIIKATQGG
ncbi:MAG: sulfur carrier protein ThiS [Mucilaginibacter sp.]